MIPVSERSWIERQVANLYGQNADSGYVEPSGKSAFYFNDESTSLLGGEGDFTTGYFIVNTGNRTLDAIATVAVNEIGIDNAYKSFLNFQSGNYASGFKEAAFALGELALVAFPVGKAAAVGTKGIPAVIRGAFKPAKMKYSNATGTVQLVSPGGVGTRIGRTVRAIPATIVNDAKKFGVYGPAVSAGRGALTAFRTALPSGARLRRLGPIGAVFGLGALAIGRDPERAAAREAAVEKPEDERVVPKDIIPTGDPIVDAGNAAKVDVAAINRQYENILRELKGMYNLSETEQEKDRLRFLLADIEAQRDAGLQAIAEGYAQTVTAMRQRGVTARADADERATRFGGQLQGYADNTAERMALQNMQQQAQFRGLGSGSASSVNEFVGLMSAMAPAQQQYTQRMGDITSEGINFMADTTSAQGQAQQADLQRLAAATRSAGIMSQQRQVGDRIQKESEQLRAATLNAMIQQANAVQSASRTEKGMDQFDRASLLQKNSNLRPGAMNGLLRSLNQPDLTPGELQLVDIYNSQYYGQDLMDAARTPAS